MTLRNWTRRLGLIALLIAGGCGGPTINQTNAAALVDDFIEGRAQLPRDNPIALPSPWYRERVFGLWRSQQWMDLARDVIENGYDIDINWFLLGEAARGGGFRNAARVYYTRALNDSRSRDNTRRCGFFSGSMCAGFVFPRDVQMRLQQL